MQQLHGVVSPLLRRTQLPALNKCLKRCCCALKDFRKEVLTLANFKRRQEKMLNDLGRFSCCPPSSQPWSQLQKLPGQRPCPWCPGKKNSENDSAVRKCAVRCSPAPERRGPWGLRAAKTAPWRGEERAKTSRQFQRTVREKTLGTPGNQHANGTAFAYRIAHMARMTSERTPCLPGPGLVRTNQVPAAFPSELAKSRSP